jgi:hypothetical protein
VGNFLRMAVPGRWAQTGPRQALPYPLKIVGLRLRGAVHLSLPASLFLCLSFCFICKDMMVGCRHSPKLGLLHGTLEQRRGTPGFAGSNTYECSGSAQWLHIQRLHPEDKRSHLIHLASRLQRQKARSNPFGCTGDCFPHPPSAT